jgi:hypothetical protein
LILEGDGIALVQQPLVRLLDGSVWTGESGSCTITARVEETIVAYRAALQELSRERGRSRVYESNLRLNLTRARPEPEERPA